jgi:hypothetical protein
MAVAIAAVKIPCKWCFPGGMSGYRSYYYKQRYENSDKHETKDCPLFKSALARNEISAIKLNNKMATGGRVCGYCGGVDHTSTKCPKKFTELKAHIIKQKQKAEEISAWLHEIGFGPGCAINTLSREKSWGVKNREYKVVAIEDFTGYTAVNFFKELLHGKLRRWFYVQAIGTDGEIVRQIYLPYNAKFSPCAGSKKTEVINRASKEEIDKLCKHLPYYANEAVTLYNTAEDFFNAGYKFVAGSKHVYKK